eukprot:6407467-Pyramimonas_sp.AAC.1
MIKITDFPKEPAQIEAPTTSTKPPDAWTAEEGDKSQYVTAAVEKITTTVDDARAMTKSRKMQ